MALGDAFLVNTAGLNLRQAANAAGVVVAVLPKGARVVQLEDAPAAAAWLHVQSEMGSGFVSSGLLSPAPPIAVSTTGLGDVDALRASRDLTLLHPTFRAAVQAVLAQLEAEAIPLQIVEAFRSPERQQALYAQGRTAPGFMVTKFAAWHSYHQYGLAADFAAREGAHWSWDMSGDRRAWWDRLHEIGREHGLEPLDLEPPHLQLQGLSQNLLLAGRYPANGDDRWRKNLEAAIARWHGATPAPPLPSGRPALYG